ncbi:cytochrome c3 family protein [bacterium]|nr:cytochrome c3 family protein [bacterium]
MAQQLRTALALWMALAMAWPVEAGIEGSAHDFSARGWSGSRICVVCHTPHRADLSVTGAPLWNHQVTAATGTYQLYSSPTLDATVNPPEHYGSKLCLSCHDGTVAVDSFGGASGSEFVTGSALIGTDLRGTHPIGIMYDSGLAITDGGLYNPETKTTPLGGTITKDLLFGTGNLECASCHDVHNTESQGNPYLLRVTTDGSALCLTCHDK